MTERTSDRLWVVYSAVRALQPLADTVQILDHVCNATKKNVSFGYIYVTLDQLEQAGYVTSRWGEATAERGWRRKRYYDTTGKFLPAPDTAGNAESHGGLQHA